MFNRKNKSTANTTQKPFGKAIEDRKQQPIHPQLEKNIQKLKTLFKDDTDFTVRPFKIFGQSSAVAIYFDSIVDRILINQDILKPLMHKSDTSIDKVTVKELNRLIFEETLYQSEGSEEKDFTKIIEELLRGSTVVFMEGLESAFLLNTFDIAERAISQPETEQVIRGPRDGFNESLNTNLSLVRYRLPSTDLRIKSMEIGTRTKTKVAFLYMEDIVDPALLAEIEERLNNIDIDRILDTGYIEENIQDNPRSPFPQIQHTERPDVVVGNVLEGRAAILVDGSPFALIAPATIGQFIQGPGDYNDRYMLSTLTRIIRVISLVISLIIPSLYVAAISFHPELIPTRFAVAITSGRTGVPFPLLFEVLLMEVAMEILREATIRMPKQIGGALSIVGVLVIGQAAVDAGFVSPLTVVIVALTTIGSFATPSYNIAVSLRMLRFPMLIMTGILGLFGFMMSWIVISNHLLSLQSFGMPYMHPLSPGNSSDMKDFVLRLPLRWLNNRPERLNSQNKPQKK
ncbi:spore germination protein KA [Natronobacillus azotifigens]|uniref:Spore germination protein n=1 Tax=Natronobacillus azotifigens TaxID=472978 RepID=A0A9J6RBH7_9BACI|nr:spore germination protein [Natronobacillus azotifigens]MCZ0702718.1 spore germination protein [Natronobacillus azotifigens]